MGFSAHKEDFWGRAGRRAGTVGAASRYTMYPWPREGVSPDEAPDLSGELAEEWKLC